MKYMISLLILMTTFTAWPREGGVSGGGGNLLSPKAPSRPVNSETAEHMILQARNVLKKYIHEKKYAFQSGALSPADMNAFEPVFNADLNVEDTIRSARLHINEKHSCWDENHQAVDGSTITPTPYSICISAHNIANKADISDITPQSAALMLHEYSELVGLSEDQAVKLQTAALVELREKVNIKK